MTDYKILFIDDYSNLEKLDKEINIGRWERAYSRGILEHNLEKYDLVVLDLDTGNGMKEDPREISSRVSKERFYLSVKSERDERKSWSRIKEWNAGGYLVMPIGHEQVAEILRGVNPESDSQLPFLNSGNFK